MIGVEPPKGTTLHVIAGGVSAPFLREFAQKHEAAGFDQVLVGYYSSSAEGFNVASHAAAHTKMLSYLVAHRPGIVSPSLAARAAATFDHLSNGRLSVHIIAGVTDQEQESEGDFLGKEARYERGAEYLSLIRRIWTSPEPFDHTGQYYRFKGAWSAVKPLQKPYPKLFFGGSSEGALQMGAEHCDVYAIYGEPLKETSERIADFRQRTAKFGRTPGFNVSFRPIIAPTEGQAWDKARRVLYDIENAGLPKRAQDKSAERMLKIAERGDVHDERLWLPIAKATGAKGNTTCLVGTPRQVADSMLRYYRLGVSSFLIRGFDPLEDTTEFGRELIPMVKQGALEIDGELAAAE
ncbi:MAG: LLM class flavin-dependent oxidoreductase [Acetobacteraceae bacterium]